MDRRRRGLRLTQFRGPNGSGVDSATGYPVEFSPTKNVVWKKAVTFGQSSPVVVGSRLYFTAGEGDLPRCQNRPRAVKAGPPPYALTQDLSSERSGFTHSRRR